MGNVKRSVSCSDDEAPRLVWNAFVDIVALEKYEDLSPLQRVAHLVFWYENEVQNGGHGQYLENRGIARIPETIVALHELGLPGQVAVLARGLGALRTLSAGVEWEWLEEGVIESFDEAFHACEPSIPEALERHLAACESEYIVRSTPPADGRASAS